MPLWFGSLLILDSTTIPLFSNLIFKGVGGLELEQSSSDRIKSVVGRGATCNKAV